MKRSESVSSRIYEADIDKNVEFDWLGFNRRRPAFHSCIVDRWRTGGFCAIRGYDGRRSFWRRPHCDKQVRYCHNRRQLLARHDCCAFHIIDGFSFTGSVTRLDGHIGLRITRAGFFRADFHRSLQTSACSQVPRRSLESSASIAGRWQGLPNRIENEIGFGCHSNPGPADGGSLQTGDVVAQLPMRRSTQRPWDSAVFMAPVGRGQCEK